MVAKSQQWVFFARITPERASITLQKMTYAIEEDFPDLGFSCRFENSEIIDSQAIVRATVLEGETDLFTLRNMAAAQLRGVIDLLGFLNGRHYELEIVSAASATNPSETFVFGNAIPALVKNTVHVSTAMLNAALSDGLLASALADFRKSMPDPTEAGFYCFRAIESVMQSFKQGNEEDRLSWDRMRGALNVDRGAIEFVKFYADDRRHGKSSPPITDAQRLKIYQITQAVVHRKLTLNLANGASLDPVEYPLVSLSSH